MAVRQRMDLRQSQTLVMTPQLQQAIKLLELSSQDLAAYVESEIEQNPLLERDEGGSEGGADPVAEPGDEPASPTNATDPMDASDFAASSTIPDAHDSPLDVDYDNLWTNDAPDSMPALPHASNGGGRGDRDGDDSEGSRVLEQTLSRATSLREHLSEQINVDLADPTERLIGLTLVEQLDEAGYVVGELTAIADRLGCSPSQIEATLSRLQQFDPPGIFARNLAECLALQLK
ncbi:MAG: RNA polymerase factor sigma-54, partial [Dongiaceae bacterium]